MVIFNLFSSKIIVLQTLLLYLSMFSSSKNFKAVVSTVDDLFPKHTEKRVNEFSKNFKILLRPN